MIDAASLAYPELGQTVERGLGPGTFRARSLNPWGDFTATPSGLLVPTHALPVVPRVPTGIDLFSGVGGFSLGFITAGFEIVAALEWDTMPMLTYLFNLGGPQTRLVFVDDEDEKRWKAMADKEAKRVEREMKKAKHPTERQMYEATLAGLTEGRWGGFGWRHSNPDKPAVRLAILGDARQVTGQWILGQLGMQRGEIDCVMGGPPCQGFSTAGKRDIMDPRNSLVFEFARLICEIFPKTCIMENVPGIISMRTPEGIPVMDALCRILEDGGMGTFEALRKSLFPGCGAAIRTKTRAKAESDQGEGDPQQEEEEVGEAEQMEFEI